MNHRKDYYRDRSSDENYNYDEKYDITGESAFSRDLTVPFDENEAYIERSYAGRNSSRRVTGSNHSGKGPKGYKRRDERIFEEVCETLYQSPDVDATEIEVEVDDGIVTLRGEVEGRIIKKIAEHLVDRLPGVVDVHNHLKLKGQHPPVDDKIQLI